MIRKENVMADKKLLIPVIVCMLLTTAVSAQKKSFTLDDLLSGGETFWNLQPKNIYTAWWGDCLVRLDASQCTAISNAKGKKNKKEEILFTLEQINASAGMEGEKVRSLYYASFDSPGKTEVTLKTSKHRVIIDWKEGRVIRRQPLVPQSVATTTTLLRAMKHTYLKTICTLLPPRGRYTSFRTTVLPTSYMDSQCTEMSSAYAKVRSGARRETVLRSTKWTKAWLQTIRWWM